MWTKILYQIYRVLGLYINIGATTSKGKQFFFIGGGYDFVSLAQIFWRIGMMFVLPPYRLDILALMTNVIVSSINIFSQYCLDS